MDRIPRPRKRTQKLQFWSWDPSLPADWRAKDAANLAAGKMTTWADDNDQFVVAYTEYLQSLVASEAEPSQAAVSQWSAINAARELAERGDPLQWEVQARLLARQTDEEIGAQVNEVPQVIHWFEGLFFNVRPRLDARVWIASRVIGDGARNGFENDQLDRLWMVFGYHGGVHVVDVLVNTFHSCWHLGEPATIGVYFRDDCSVPLEMQAAIASCSIPVTEETNRKFTEIHARLQKIKATMRPAESKVAMDELRRKMVRLWQSSRPKVDDAHLPLPETVLVEETMVGNGQRQSADGPIADVLQPASELGRTAG